jgi:AbrB family looped-hinge helix DNA binding protein
MVNVGTMEQERTCCKLEAVVSVDPRGQILLPKDVRQKAGINQGEKLLVISCGDEDSVCCLTLVKADDSSEMVKEMIGPMMKGVLNG